MVSVLRDIAVAGNWCSTQDLRLHVNLLEVSINVHILTVCHKEASCILDVVKIYGQQ